MDLTPGLPPYVVSQESVVYGLTVSGSSSRLGAVVAHSNAFYLYSLEVGPQEAVGEPQLLYHSPKLAMSPVLSHDGDVAVIATTERTGKLQYTLLAFDVSSGTRLGELEDAEEASLEPITCSPRATDPRVLATSNRSGYSRPLLWNPRTGECSDLLLDGLEGEVLLTGWSYGGYLTLQAMGKYPGLWAGGMGGVAVADRVLQYEYSSDKHKGYIASLFGGTPREKPEQYRKSSPITYVERVDAPILLIQGRNDTRCPARQVEAYEEKMRAQGKPIEILWFDAGHGSLSIEQEIVFQEHMLRFAYRVLEHEHME